MPHAHPLVAIAALVAGLTPSLSPSLARADPRGEALIAQLKAASGGAALDRVDGFHERGTVVRDGVAGTYEMWADLRGGRTHGTHSLGGRTAGGGYDGKVSWGVDPQGQVHTDASPQGLAEARMGAYVTLGGYYWPDRFPATFTYKGRLTAPDGKAYDVVTVAPKDALTADLWLDPDTHRLRRLSAQSGEVSLQGDVLADRIIEGTVIGVKLAQTEGEHHMTQEITGFTYLKVPEDKLAPPSAP